MTEFSLMSTLVSTQTNSFGCPIVCIRECWIEILFQVPTIIESTTANGKKKDSVTTLSSRHEDYGACKEPIDVKSYISLSRNDISPWNYSQGAELIRGGTWRALNSEPSV